MAAEINDIARNVPKGKLPKGVFVSGSAAIISDKSTVLEMFDKDYPVFLTDEDGDMKLIESVDEIKRHSGNFSVSTDDVYDFLEIERSDPEKERKEENAAIQKAEEQNEVLTHISVFIGASISQLYALPADVKEDLIGVYRDNFGTVDNAALAVLLNTVLDGKPPIAETQHNYLQSAEELVEGNYNSIDGVINNVPKQENSTEEKPSVMAFLKEHAVTERTSFPQEITR